MFRLQQMALAAVLAVAAIPAAAQTATSTPAEAFVHAVSEVCAKNAFGDLPLNPPSAALEAARVLLVDGGSDPDVRGAFHDMPVTIDYGAVPSTGQIVIGADEAGSCRVAAIDASAADVAAIQAALRAGADSWNPIANDPTKGETTYSGTIGGESAMVAVLIPPAGSNWGKAGILVTVMNPAAGS
jgi:hypothetical protein